MRLSNLLAALAMALVTIGQACAGQTTVTLDDHTFEVEVATTPASRERGLMWRVHMAPGHGMLFVFPRSQPRWFWMKNTLIPLDILYFSSDGELVSISHAVQPCRSATCPSYASGKPARYVLELNGGAAKRLDLEVGDMLTLPDEPFAVR